MRLEEPRFRVVNGLRLSTDLQSLPGPLGNRTPHGTNTGSSEIRTRNPGPKERCATMRLGFGPEAAMRTCDHATSQAQTPAASQARTLKAYKIQSQLDWNATENQRNTARQSNTFYKYHPSTHDLNQTLKHQVSGEMPVFQETANSARDLRILPSRALPLPRISLKPSENASQDQREVVVIGVRQIFLSPEYSPDY